MRLRSVMLAVVAGAFATAAGAATPKGVWANPARSVHVTFKQCGRAMCGRVVWASPKARADAQQGGTEQLVGAELFSDFVEEEPGLWSGEVFIPDIGRSVEGTITQTGPRTLIGEGCLFGRLGCKTQTWTRIK